MYVIICAALAGMLASVTPPSGESVDMRFDEKGEFATDDAALARHCEGIDGYSVRWPETGAPDPNAAKIEMDDKGNPPADLLEDSTETPLGAGGGELGQEVESAGEADGAAGEEIPAPATEEVAAPAAKRSKKPAATEEVAAPAAKRSKKPAATEEVAALPTEQVQG